ncbi:MAG TPA: acetate/propionate family kinase [Woeseiaceae bacterium]|nr:acetate/propionate family kinase [Woeseiaceae bacterium]
MSVRRLAVVNTGSATLKLAQFEAGPDGLRERSSEKHEWESRDEMDASIEQALRAIGEAPDILGHRVVHGGSQFIDPVLIDGKVEAALEELVSLAPLHNGPALTGIRVARRVFPDTPGIAVFDTAFHARRPQESMRYALPREWQEEFGFLRYGFHGIAHASLAQSYAKTISQPLGGISAVTLQLGAGCSACAVRNGRSIETSMGYTPLEGLVMATRSGDIDPAIVLELARAGHTPEEIDEQLNRRSGLLGLAGSSDMREVLAAEARGDEGARLALRLFVYRLVLTIGAYLTLLGGDGAIVFGGGIGEHAAEIRARVAKGLTAWNVELDPALNRDNGPGRISAEQTRPVYVFETREEEMIARELLDFAL